MYDLLCPRWEPNHQRHHEISHTFGVGIDLVVSQDIGVNVAEYSGNLPACKAILALQQKALEELIEQTRSRPVVSGDGAYWFFHAAPGLVEFTAAFIDDNVHAGVQKLLELVGCSNIDDCKDWVRSSKDWVPVKSMTLSSSDGNHRTMDPEASEALVCALLSLSSPALSGLSSGWLDELAEPSSPSHNDCAQSFLRLANLRVLVSSPQPSTSIVHPHVIRNAELRRWLNAWSARAG